MTPIPKTDMDAPRRSGGKASRRIAWPSGIINPAAKPWMMRAKTSAPKLGAIPHRAEATVNPTTAAP